MNEIFVEIEAELQELIPAFFLKRREDVTSLRQALSRRDFVAVAEAGHRIKGTAAGYGFETIAGIGADLERAARSADSAAALGLVARLESYLQCVRVVYK